MADLDTEIYSFNAIIIGTGAAGYNSALRLRNLGVEHVAIVTDGIQKGTSRNTGSDKQTYYKISMEGDSLDSVEKMAKTYFNGRAMDGDHALIEASYSARCFFNLVELGVPFPKNSYGEYVGYKTDHDPCTRATSIGPYTSKKMTECLEKAVIKAGVTFFDDCQVIKILQEDNKVYGVICFSSNCFKVFLSSNIIFATGGPAGMYKNSVYPESQIGATGVLFECGVKGKNLTEWQCGLASITPRWNVSGSYMQVIPRFVSTKEDLSDEKEFLVPFFNDIKLMNSMIFLKGYQWPFDVRKVESGSSIIDILVYIETAIKHRRVFLDFKKNASSQEFSYEFLSDEAIDYLERAGVIFGTPIERLKKMNYPAYDLFLGKGVDLEKEMLEIALCVQHNNGGISVDANWETDIKGLYVVGEAAGTHGVYRPGGSALNAGQVGSLRAAEHISKKKTNNNSQIENEKVEYELNEAKKMLDSSFSGKYYVKECLEYFRLQMSEVGSAIRDKEMINRMIEELRPFVNDFSAMVKIISFDELGLFFRLRNLVLCQFVYLSAMLDYAERGLGSRGSSLYHNQKGVLSNSDLPEIFRYILEKDNDENMVQEISLEDGCCCVSWRQTRPIPLRDNFFENVWKQYRQLG